MKHHINTIDKSEKIWFAWTFITIAVSVIFLVLSLAFSGCSAEKRAEKHLNRAYVLSPVTVAKKCNSYFIPITETKVDTQYLLSDPIEVHDSVYVDCDSVINSFELQHKKVVKVKMPCPPCPPCNPIVITKTVTVTANNQAILDVADKKINEFRDKYLFWFKYSIVLSAFVLIFVALKYFNAQIKSIIPRI